MPDRNADVPFVEALARVAPLPPPPPAHRPMPDLRVAVILTPRFSLLPVASLIDCLRHAADEADHSRPLHCSWEIVGTQAGLVTASCGLAMEQGGALPDPRRFDYVVVAGGQLPWSLDVPARVLAYLREAHAAGACVAGICTGSFVLARAGLLDGRSCAVHIEHRAQLEALFPRVRARTDQVFIRDGNVLTCPGGTAAIDLATALISHHCGRSRAVKSLTSLLVERHRAAFTMPPRSFAHLATCGNRTVEQAVEIMERHLEAPFALASLAATLHVSPRELSRAFARHAGCTAGAVWRRMRLDHARWMLLSTSRSVTEIAVETGFADAAHFSRWFRRAFGLPPSAFRAESRLPPPVR